MFKMKTMALTITIMILSLFLAVNHVEAASFSDVPSDHWAKSYIDRCTNEGIIKGYPDNTFKPSNEISFTEISSLLSGLLNVTESEMQTANTTYGQKIIQLNVPDWARPAVLKCLYKGVYSLANLEVAAKAGMLDDTKGVAVTRANCAVFFSQAMGLSSQLGSSGLTYHDLTSISESARPHIIALQKVGVLSPQGDGYGYFHPMSGIDRASIAKMLTVAIDYLKKNQNVTPTPTPTPTVSIKTVSGIVKNISSFGGQNYIIITKSDGKDEAFSIDVSTKVTIDTIPAFVTQIKEGMEATLTYDDNTKKATIGIFKTSESKVEGIIKDMPRYGKKVEVEYKSGSTTKTDEFDFEGADVYVDGKKASFDDLRKGYEVILYIKGEKMTKVEAKKGQSAFDGYFVAFSAPTSYNRTTDIEVEEENSDSYYNRSKFYTLDRYYVYINGKKYSTSDLTDNRFKDIVLQPGMPIRLKFNSRDEVTEIETVFNPDTKEGVIWAYINREVSYNSTYIYISPSTYRYTSSGQAKTLKLPRDMYYVRVYIDNKEARIQDLKRDDWAKITMHNGEVDTIEVVRSGGTSNTTSKNIASGECYDISVSEDFIDMNLDSSTTSYNSDFKGLWSQKFLVDNRTTFYHATGSQVRDFSDWARLVRTKYGNAAGDNLEIEYEKIGDKYYARVVRFKR